LHRWAEAPRTRATKNNGADLANDQEQQGQIHIRGKVKWFDPSKGFGFIVAQSGGPDILLHANVLRNFGQSSVAEDAAIEVLVQDTPRGRQAVEVIRIEPPAAPTNGGLEDIAQLDPDTLAAIPLVPARVKWFDKAKGFGFANIFGRPEDVFIHIEVLRRSGFADLQPGEAVSLKVIQGRRGRLATLVAPWDAAPRIDED
jgi:CspA family cold shock protein